MDFTANTSLANTPAATSPLQTPAAPTATTATLAHPIVPTSASKPGKRLTKLQQHNNRLATQLADANKRIARLKFERALLLDKLFEHEKRSFAAGSDVDILTGSSSESEGEYRECEWWRDVDVAAVLSRNPIHSVAAPKKSQAKKSSSAKRKHTSVAVTDESESELATTGTEDEYPNVRSSGMLFEFDAPPTSATGSSPPNAAAKKRRSNKASACDAVLKTLAVERDEQGRPVLPLNVGVVTIEQLGDIVYDRQAYHNRRYILPVGFHSTRPYLSTVDPNTSTAYHSRILDGGAAPVFQVTADDAPDSIFQGPTSTGAWSAVVRAANQIRFRDYSNSASGPDYFGLSNATVAMLIEELPNSDRCINYQKKRFERGAAHVKQPKRPAADSGEAVSGVASELDH